MILERVRLSPGGTSVSPAPITLPPAPKPPVRSSKWCFIMGIVVGVVLGAILNIKVASSIYVTDTVTVLPASSSIIVSTSSANPKKDNMSIDFLPPNVQIQKEDDNVAMLRGKKQKGNKPIVVAKMKTDNKKKDALKNAIDSVLVSGEDEEPSSVSTPVTEPKKSSSTSNPVASQVLDKLKQVRNEAIQKSHQLTYDLEFPPPPSVPQLVLLRSIGNPLPPRHDPEQAIHNLNFTLTYEPDYSKYVYKHWVLNRLVDSDLETRLIALLDQHKKPYTRIPFELDVYEKTPYNYTLYEPNGVKDVVHDKAFNLGKFPNVGQVEEAVSNAKNLYVTNQNAARNTMMDIGVQAYPDSEWILPWDGNCFVHPNAMHSLLWDVDKLNDPEQKYYYTPMNRAMGNEEVFSSNYNPDPIEEPQVIFRRTAKGRFQENLRYGRRNKVEMIQRMKIPGPWDKWSKYLDWEKETLGPIREPLTDLAKPASKIGWVTRLSSGVVRLETKGTIHDRGVSRVQSMLLLFGKLDARVVRELHGWSPDKLLFYNEEALKRDRELYRDPRTNPAMAKKLQRVAQNLTSMAAESLQHGPWSVTDKPKDSLAPSNDPHDYYHPAPYYWPVRSADGTIDESAKYERRDGQRVPGTVLYDELSDRFDRTRLTAMQYNTTVLSLAYYITGNEIFAKKAATNIRKWFLDPETRMNPSLSYAQIRRNHHNNSGFSFGVIEMKDLYFMLDAVRIVERGGFLSKQESEDLRVWFKEYMEWLETSDMGRKEYTAGNNHGLYYDIQLISVAAFINNPERMMWYLERSISRMHTQFRENGEMPHEMNRPICEHYQMFTLQGWATLSRLSESVYDRVLWDEYKDMNGMSLMCRAAKFSLPFYTDRPVCKPESDIDNIERWWPLLQDSRNYCKGLAGQDTEWPAWYPLDAKEPPSHAFDMENVFYPHDGIAPFWNLGLSHADKEIPIGKLVAIRDLNRFKSAQVAAAAAGRATALEAVKKKQKKKKKKQQQQQKKQQQEKKNPQKAVTNKQKKPNAAS